MKVYKYRSVVDNDIISRDINSFKSNQFYASNFKNLNDKFEANFDELISDTIDIIGTVFSTETTDFKNIFAQIISYKEKIGIFCLSKNPFNETLWAYYSSDNKGYCIQYDLEKLIGKTINKEFSTVLEVEYCNGKPVVTFSDFQKANMISKMFATKKQRWKHEEEVRLIFDNIGLMKHHESAITGIYFGCDANDKFIEKIISEFKDRDIIFYKIIVNSNTNEFEEEIIAKNFKNYNYDIDIFKFNLVKTIDFTAISYYLHIQENYTQEQLQHLALGFKERNFYKPSNIYFINNLNVLDIIEKYPKSDQEYLHFAESIVADFSHDCFELCLYPFKDFRYEQITNI